MDEQEAKGTESSESGQSTWPKPRRLGGSGAMSSLVFVPYSGTDRAGADPSLRRRARSHAMRQAGIAKRTDSRQRLENFRPLTVADFENNPVSAATQNEALVAIPPVPGPSSSLRQELEPGEDCMEWMAAQMISAPMSPLMPTPEMLSMQPDPADSLSVPLHGLMSRMQDPQTKFDGESIFKIDRADSLQSMATVYPSIGFTDEAICNGLALNLALASNYLRADQDCLQYMDTLMKSINERLQDPVTAQKDTTISAISLLAAIECRLGNWEAVEWHMNGIKRILGLRKGHLGPLNTAMRRGLFWQDLLAAMCLGTDRIFKDCKRILRPEEIQSRDEAIFDSAMSSELESNTPGPSQEMEKEQSLGSFASTPVSPLESGGWPTASSSTPYGFESNTSVLTPSLHAALIDLHTLSMTCDNGTSHLDLPLKLQMDKKQGWILSRFVDLQAEARSLGKVAECINVAAFMCAFVLDMSTWNSKYVPASLPERLLVDLEATKDLPYWTNHVELLWWLIVVGCFNASSPDVKQWYKQHLAWAESRFSALRESSFETKMDWLQSFILPKRIRNQLAPDSDILSDRSQHVTSTENV